MGVGVKTQTRLLEAAGQVFAEKGYQAATVRDILGRAGIKNIAAVNYYFGDKEKLYRETLRHAFRDPIARVLMPDRPADAPPAVKLREFIRTIVLRMVGPDVLPWQMQLLLRELSQPTAAGEEIIREFIRPIYETLGGLLREVLPAGVSEEQLHLTSFSIIGQCLYLRVARPLIGVVVGQEEARGYDAERLAEHVANFTVAALGLGRPPSVG